MTTRIQRRRLADILVDEGLVAKEDVQQAVQIRESTGEALGAVLVDMGRITPPEITKVICVHFQLPFISFDKYEFDAKLIQLFPNEFLHQHKILPFDCIGQMLLCAVMEIPSPQVLAEIPRITKRKGALFVAHLDTIDKYLKEHCPLSEDSALVNRRRHIGPTSQTKPEDATAEKTDKDNANLFTDSTNQDLLQDLASTWDNIFDAVEKGHDGEEGE